MRILGLDISTHLGVAVFDSEGYTTIPKTGGGIVYSKVIYYPAEKDLKASDAKRFERYERYATAIEQIVDSQTPDVAYIEGYGYSNPYTLAPLVELGTLARSVLYDSAIPWHEVAPMTLKKFVTGDGKAKKNQMLLAVYKQFAIECSDDNEADAIGLAFYGAAHKGFDVGLPMTRLKALKLDKLVRDQ